MAEHHHQQRHGRLRPDGQLPDEGFNKGNYGEPDVYKPAEMTNSEMENVRKLIRELGL